MLNTTAAKPADVPEPFRVEFTDQPHAPATATTYTEALALVAREKRCTLSGLLSVYDTAARSFLVWLPGAFESLDTLAVARIAR